MHYEVEIARERPGMLPHWHPWIETSFKARRFATATLAWQELKAIGVQEPARIVRVHDDGYREAVDPEPSVKSSGDVYALMSMPRR